MKEEEDRHKQKHSIKLPYLYKTGSKILKAFEEKKGTLKNLVYATRQERLFRRLLALVCRAVDHGAQVEAALSAVGLLRAEPGLEPATARLLAAELLYGSGRLASQARPVLTLLRYADRLRAAAPPAAPPTAANTALPRYVRVNTLLTTVSEAVSELTAEGWQQLHYDADISYHDFIRTVRSLEESQFLVDLHVPCLLTFPPNTEFHQHRLYTTGRLILQDKASCLPPLVLNPTAGDHVIDACSAPGMKTSQLAALMHNKGTVLAVERDERRYRTLSVMLQKAGVSNTRTLRGDFLTLRPDDFPQVTGILLDPSCSGTGMTGRSAADRPGAERLQRLAGLQRRLLRHALSFPAVRRVVYSTCSVTEQENEQVVADTLCEQTEWRLTAAAPSGWPGRARPSLPGAELCIRADPAADLCHGFFVAAFERSAPQPAAGRGAEKGVTAQPGGRRKRKVRSEAAPEERTGDVPPSKTRKRSKLRAAGADSTGVEHAGRHRNVDAPAEGKNANSYDASETAVVETRTKALETRMINGNSEKGKKVRHGTGKRLSKRRRNAMKKIAVALST